MHLRDYTEDTPYSDMTVEQLDSHLTIHALNDEQFPIDAEFALLSYGLDPETFRSDIVKEYNQSMSIIH